MTSEEHNKYISWVFLANGLFQMMILAFVLMFMYLWMSFSPGGRDLPPELLAVVLGFAGVINLFMLSPNFVAAYAVNKRKPWARTASIVAAALAAVSVPLGTLAAVYSLWFFCGEQWKEVYPEASEKRGHDQLSAAAAAEWEGYTKEDEAAFTYRTPPPPDWR